MSQQEVSREVQEIWALFREVAKRQEEAGAQIREAGNKITEVAKRQEEAGNQIREVARRQEDTDREIRLLSRENDKRFKDLRELFTGQWGKLVEALVEPSVLRLFQERGIQVIDTAQRLKTRRNGTTMEIDILATNEDSVIAIEVKTTLKVEDVNFFIEKLLHFSEFFPKYKGLKLYGAVAGIRIEEESDRYADPSQQTQDKGLFVLTLSGEGMFASLTDACLCLCLCVGLLNASIRNSIDEHKAQSVLINASIDALMNPCTKEAYGSLFSMMRSSDLKSGRHVK